MEKYVIHITFVDRLGLGYEIFEVFKNRNINLLGMEAKANQGMAIKCAETSLDEAVALMHDLERIEGVVSVEFRYLMPYEQREHALRAILNSTRDGIIALNKDGRITHLNDVATQILQLPCGTAIGKSLEEFPYVNIPISEILRSGNGYSFKETRTRKDHKAIHFISSGVPILDEEGSVIGAVITIKDYSLVEEIISKVDRKKQPTTFESIICQSPKMKKVVETAQTVARGNSTVMLRGESGTGKELFAKAIHMESSRSQTPFIAINCGALPDSLLESELFGYEEGAFTGAAKGGKKGLFEQANSGTLFLDEIGEISPQVQVRLLRVLQEGIIRRLGGVSEVPVDVRIIAATHRNLEEMIKLGQFREDLYYRLNVIPLEIPPLRERCEDIPLITQHLMRKICHKLDKTEPILSRESVTFLMAQDWPGNVRQLENVLERILNVTNVREIEPEYFYEWANVQPDKRAKNGTNKHFEIRIPIDEYSPPPLKEIVSEAEKQILRHVLQTHSSSRKAGNILGVSNTTVLNKMKAYNLLKD